jgi:hypothetical protein
LPTAQAKRRWGRTTDSLEAAERFPSCALKAV